MSKLMIIENRGEYQIAWNDGEGEPGLIVGQSCLGSTYPFPKPADQSRDAKEVWAANNSLVDKGYTHTNLYGYSFGTLTEARKALRLVRHALKNMDVPMPDWAKTAIAEGWKPPKGWKP